MPHQIPATCDVAVIGGGPGGSLTAALLARAGHHVVLMDKQQHPRYAVGESLIPHFWKYMDHAGLTEKIEQEGFVRKAGGIVSWHGQARGHTFKSFGYTRPALHVERARFDEILLDHAAELGAQIHQNISVTRVADPETSAPQVHYRHAEGSGVLNTRVVVDASGQSALLAKQLGHWQVDEDFRYMSVWGYYPNTPFVDAEGAIHPADQLSQHTPVTFVSSLPMFNHEGWAWFIVLRGQTSVGLVLPRSAVQAQKESGLTWAEFFDQTCRAIPTMGDLLSGIPLQDDHVHIIRDYSYTTREVAGPGYYLVGDAAGFVDPIFSIGMVLALFSGSVAAWAIERTLADPAAAARNAAIYSQQLRARMEMSRALALPRYRPDRAMSEVVDATLRMENRNLHELIYLIGVLTERKHSLDSLLTEAEKETVLREKVREIHEFRPAQRVSS